LNRIKLLVQFMEETIHQYLKVNWQNIVTVRSELPEIREFVEKARTL
jgi:hypothetical protein